MNGLNTSSLLKKTTYLKRTSSYQGRITRYDAVAYGWDNLMFLCIECHNAIHAEIDAMTTPNGLTSGASLLVRPTRGMIFNEMGDLVAVNDNECDND